MQKFESSSKVYKFAKKCCSSDFYQTGNNGICDIVRLVRHVLDCDRQKYSFQFPSCDLKQSNKQKRKQERAKKKTRLLKKKTEK